MPKRGEAVEFRRDDILWIQCDPSLMRRFWGKPERDRLFLTRDKDFGAEESNRNLQR